MVVRKSPEPEDESQKQEVITMMRMTPLDHTFQPESQLKTRKIFALFQKPVFHRLFIFLRKH